MSGTTLPTPAVRRSQNPSGTPGGATPGPGADGRGSRASAPVRRSSLGKRLGPYGYLAPVIALMLVLMILPVAVVIRYSFFDNVIISPTSIVVGLKNYVTILTDPAFHTATKNTLVFTGVSVAAHLVIGLGFAMLLNSTLIGNRTKTVFRTIFVMPWLLTVAIIAILWRLLLDPNGVVNYGLQSVGLIDGPVAWFSELNLALPAVTVMNIWAGYPFFMISLLAGLQGISTDLYEAAAVDGASWWGRFVHVTLPSLRPVIISMALLDVIWTSQQFPLIWMTTGGGPLDRTEMLSTYTYKLAFSEYQFAQAAASAVIMLVIALVLAVLYVRHQRARD
ncbi:carbohydrate ABC transporter permease [Terracoccus luteus]|jgi:multiple sugar transport system permease protein|uniref:Carbohydrate ABC transporter membrane protein 1 (CUT1 family) n=1 Tax=Terracoccus luteus TaxID=53356 RepID=A0A495Y2T4_9MICO|nr:sugar ABC transporter permease [Terracoccus luteus]MBB2986510.1 multiple sugar transport system permease protein [Terracoccus luteus]MCP2171901.1 multiple sugar transport system permease protein [Terracoccus luteus]RKT79263.1 carbohydrate ABC transporter membrane protein 1 (CUT1 family) [Terracoccus luteus]